MCEDEDDECKECPCCLACANWTFIVIVMFIKLGAYTSWWLAIAIPWSFHTSFVGWINIICLHTVFGLMEVAYWRTVMANPGYVDRDWVPTGFTEEEMAEAKNNKDNPRDRRHKLVFNRCRYCNYCQAWKPPRSHHCKEVKRCVMRMDHYCPWVYNVVGLGNHKTFLLFLFYSSTALTYFLILLLWRLIYVIQHLGKREMMDPVDLIMFILNFVLTLPVTIAIMSLFFYQLSIATKNLTSIETYLRKRFYRAAKRRGDKHYHWPYDLGWRKNIEQMMGKHVYQWFTPEPVSMVSGYNWKTRPQTQRTPGNPVVVEGAKVSKRPSTHTDHND